MELHFWGNLRFCPNGTHPHRHQKDGKMNLERLGAISEARALAEILLAMPTTDNFANYRRAVINISRVFDCSFEEATHMIRNLVDKF